MKRQTIRVQAELAAEIAELLGRTEADPSAKRDAVLHTLTVNFGDGIEADIKVCNGDSPWVDAVLFEHGQEIAVHEPGESLLGEYNFEVDGETYVVSVESA